MSKLLRILLFVVIRILMKGLTRLDDSNINELTNRATCLQKRVVLKERQTESKILQKE